MKKYLMRGMAAMAVSAAFVSCSQEVDLGNTPQRSIQETYEKAFITRFGTPVSTQDWGFGDDVKAGTRSQATPACPDYTPTITEAWVADYLETAKEPNSSNINDNYDDGTWVEATDGHWVIDKEATNQTVSPTWPQWNWIQGSVADQIAWNYGSPSEEDKKWFQDNCKALIDKQTSVQSDQSVENVNAYIDLVKDVYDKCEATNRSWITVTNFGAKGGTITTEEEKHWVDGTEGYWKEDETFVLNFKITEEYTGTIGVAATEGYTTTWNDTKKINELSNPNGYARTVVVTGTWNINQEQRIGSGAKIIVANGGKINIGANGQLNFVNQAQLVVLYGGEITGDGLLQVTNGNADGEGSYNRGTISVHKFNNNFGKFFNYGTFNVDVYAAGAAESNFYNHNIAIVGSTYETANGGSYTVSSNARIYNACQWWSKGNMRARNIEMVSGSYMQVDGELMMSGSEDGTTDASYVGLAAGAYIKCITLNNNGTSWTGPTENGYAVVEITDKISYLNWAQDTTPLTYGYFENNIYVKAGTWTNVPSGNGKQQTDPADADNYAESIADYKFWRIVANGYGGTSAGPGTVARGNGNVTKVNAGNTEIIPASEGGFILGEKGCTPGFKGDTTPPQKEDDPEWEAVRVIAEDLSVDQSTDFDFNDVVFDVRRCTKGNSKVSVGTTQIVLRAAGGTLPLYVDGHEVHEAFGVDTKVMVNTHASGRYNGVDDRDSVVFSTTNDAGKTIRQIAKDIRVYVIKKIDKVETECDLTAPHGDVASKLAVGVDYEWCNERQDIDEKYTLDDGTSLFKAYVQGELGTDWYLVGKTHKK